MEEEEGKKSLALHNYMISSFELWAMKLQAVLAAGRMGGDMGKLITTTGQSAQLLDGGV